MPLTAAEFEAFRVLAQQRKEAARIIFRSGKLKFTTSSILKTSSWNAKNMASIVKETRSAVRAGAGAGNAAASELSKSVFDTDNVKSMIAGVAPEIVKDVTTFVDCIPGVSQLVGGLNCIRHLAKATKKAWDQCKLLEKGYALRVGDPLAALLAVDKVIEDKKSEDLGKFGINATHVAVSGALLAADGGIVSGPATGALKAMASLAFRMWLIARDLKYIKIGNELLTTPEQINLETFRTCPILGCYYLTEASTSDVANFMIADIGLPNWMDKVEEMAPKVTKIQEKSAKLIRNSRIQIEGLQTDFWRHSGLTRKEKVGRFFKKKFGRG